MIVVEGVDGSGKSNLVKKLTQELKLPVHERACTSVGGPVDNLFEWASNDVLTWNCQPLSIYDRHPFISEYVYGPIIRGTIDPGFLSLAAKYHTQKFYRNALVIHCDPGMDEVSKNIRHSGDGQMGKVSENADALYLTYASLMHYWPSSRGVFKWNYRTTQLDDLLEVCDVHIQYWNA